MKSLGNAAFGQISRPSTTPKRLGDQVDWRQAVVEGDGNRPLAHGLAIGNIPGSKPNCSR